MKKYKQLSFILSILLVLILSACGSSSNTTSGGGIETNNNEEVIKLKIAHVAPEGNAYHIGVLEFVEAVEKETNGRVQFEVFCCGQLGGEIEVIEKVSLGMVDMTLASASPTVGFVENYGVLDLPFLFRDSDHAHATLDGDIGQDLLEELSTVNIKGIAFWERGFNHFANNKHEVRSVDDLKGLKVRAAQNDVSVEAYTALGAFPTPIAWPEVHTSLQQGVVEGMDNGIGVLASSGVYEVLDYYSLTDMFYAAATLMINEDKLNTLPEDIQEIILKLGKEYAHREREIVKEMEAEQLATMKENGLAIIEKDEIDMDSFRKAVTPVYDKFESRFGNYVERIRNVK